MEKLLCSMCGKEKKLTEFYASKSIINEFTKKMSICKSCTGKIYEMFWIKHRDEKQALYHMCRKLDLCFNLSSYNSCVSEISSGKKTPLYQIYMTKLNSLGGNNGAGNDFDSSDMLDSSRNFEKVVNEFEVTPEMVLFWGKGYTDEDYEMLTNEYRVLCDKFENDLYSQDMLFQEISHQRLDIKKKRQQGLSVDKELKTLQDLLGSANIKPVQESASMANEQVTLGTLIKKYENEKPVPEPLPEWMTADWIRKYVVVWFFGNLCRMMGKPNNFQNEYEQEMSEYTVKVNNEEEGE